MRGLLRKAVTLAAVLLASAAVAQRCTYEVEPNDLPSQATVLDAVGPDAVGAARRGLTGAVCLTGEFTSGDQDAFVWDVDEAAAANVWTVEIEGARGAVTQLDLIDVEFADNGVDAVRSDGLLRFATDDGSVAVSGTFIVAPGRYLIGMSQAGVAGQYVVNLRPTPLAQGSSSFREGVSHTGAFTTHAQLSGGFEVPFRITDDQAGYVWGASFHAPIGTAPTLSIEGPGGTVAQVTFHDHGPVRLSNLGLPAGEYRARVQPASAAESGLVSFRLEAMGLAANGVEIEPNNSWGNASWFGLGEEVKGITGDDDYFIFEVPSELAGSAWDLNLDSDTELLLRLYDSDRKLLQERRGVRGTTRALHLEAGSYYLVLRGGDGGAYSLSLTAGQLAEPGSEREPNDQIAGASPMGPEDQARGELWAQDVDFFGLEVTGAAQRYRLQVVGQGVTELALYDAAGSRLARATGERRIRLDEVVLLPGTNYLRVSGDGGEYALRALSLGPAPEPTPSADAPAKDERLAPVAVARTEDESVEAAASDPQLAALPPLPPPPPGLLETEPNDDESRAQRLEPGLVHVGRLSSTDDRDHYRFSLAADQYTRVELVPAEGETGWDLRLDGMNVAAAKDGSVSFETWLLAGNHRIELAGSWLDTAPSGYYQLRLTPLGTLGLPIDLEPNDRVEEASLLPAELTWSGRVGEARDNDYYRLPVFAADTTLTVTSNADEGVRYHLVKDGRGDFEAADDGSLMQTLPAGEQTYLRVLGEGEYQVEVAFSSRPDPTMLLPARAGSELELRLAFDQTQAAAFWHAGQRLAGTLDVTNVGTTTVTAGLAAAADNAGVIIELPADVTVGAGESVSVAVTALLPSDVSDQAPLSMQVAATGGASLAVTGFDLALRCEAQPVDPFAYSSATAALAGRPNVLFAGFGATVVAGSTQEPRDSWINDGRTTVSHGGRVSTEHSPTFRLAGDEPVTLIGTVINPTSDQDAGRQLRTFRIETSLDGVTYQPVLEAGLSAARVDQAFEFESPVTARFARLVGIDAHGGVSPSYFGEWKLISDDPALFSGLDLALPELGGNVVWSRPLLGSGDHIDVLSVADNVGALDLRDHEGFTFAIGFDNARAALIRSLQWLQVDEDAERLFDTVEVAVSMTGAAGPWQVVGEWSLGGPATNVDIELAEPVWARYVRLSAPKRDGERYYYPPHKVAVNEAFVADGYLSALAEWGTNARVGPYEHLVSFPDGAAVETADAGDTREQATPLTSGQVVTGTVAVAEDVDWYRVTVPQGENHLAVRLAGDPTIAYRYELTMADGGPVAFDATNEGDDVVISAYVEPGDYLLKLEEPKRTVIFAWDTSGSVSAYQPITYSSLASFARGVDGDRESVQLLAFDEPSPKWLLPRWSDDPERVQRAITQWNRNADSSNSELALLTAVDALADRDGTKAILFITDAETGGYDFTARLWEALSEVRPQVFTFEISSSGRDAAQDLMQNWAAVNGGVYEMASGVGAFDSGFSRASCLLRRPKRYTVEVTTSAVEPPGPGTLTVTPSATAGAAGVHVIFDASGSMGQLLPSGESRMAAAKQALEGLIGAALEEATPFSLRAFGHVTPNSCETRLDVRRGPLDRAAALAAVRAIEPKLLSQTAIADSLLLAVDDLAGSTGPRTVILITDGKESCGGDPAAAAAALRAAGDTNIAIVSLALGPADLAVFESLADEIGATYVDVTSFEGLSEAIAAALKPAFEVFDSAGELVATGRVGESIELPMGVYRVRVLTAPAEVFDDVRVPGDGSVRVMLGGN